jgi:hypothetical protein
MVRHALLAAALAAVLGAGAPLAHADTYKWIDAKGVVNYSSTPPPGGAKTVGVQTVPDRISVYATDPAVNREVELYRRMDLAEAEWLQRQQLMAMQAAAVYPPEPVYRTAAYFPVSRVGFPARQSRRAASRRP